MDDSQQSGQDNVQAEGNSIAIGGLSVGGNVGDIRIGHTIGYSPEQVSVLLSKIRSEFQPKAFDGRCPYKGLAVFEEEDADLFFGRERLVEDLLSRVRESRTVFITGPSGSGKSSLVRAGLLHSLKQGAIKGSERWLYETMKPGREPIEDLALAFSRLKGPALADYFQAHAAEADVLHKCAESALSGNKDQRFVLFVDQFEEVFTQVNQEAERLAFLEMLAHAGTAGNGRVIVLFAMRSDFVSNCASYSMLNELLSKEFRQIGAMQPEELVAAIALPARHVGLPVEPGLIAQIINDMKGEPGALPLMQFALKDLFDSQQEKGGVIALTLEDYLRHGGIHKSLERHADRTFGQLGEGEQELARSIFSGLIEIGRGTVDTRRTALFDELIPADTNAGDVLTVVQKLADARLVITDEQAGTDTVTISHEKLIDAWPWLRQLVNENRDVIALQNAIASDAKEWEEHRRDPSYLYTGARLATAREQLATQKLVLNGLAQEFIQAGIRAYTEELEAAKQRAAQLRRRTLYLSTALVAALIAVGMAVFFGLRSRQQSQIALARQLAAQAQSINVTTSSKQMIGVLLSIQSMKLSPTDIAANYLLNNNLATRPIARVTHEKSVNSVAFSPDGEYIVSGSSDNTARVCETTTGEEIALMTHEGFVTSVAFSPDGKYVVSGSRDGTARVWEVASGTEVARMSHDDDVFSVAFSPDGKHIVSGSWDHTARVWETTTGTEVARMTHDYFVNSVAFSPDGKYIVSGSWDHTARVWETTSGTEVARMTHDSQVHSAVFSPDGKYVVSGGDDGTARVWEVATGTEVALMTHDSRVNVAAFSPDGQYIVSGSWDNTARVWETTSGTEVARMSHDDDVFSVAFSPDGKHIVSGSWDHTTRVWETTTGTEVARMTYDGEVTSVAFSLDGKYVLSGSYDGTARVWKPTSDREIARMTHDDQVYSVAFSPDGKYVVSGSGDWTARIWKAVTGKEMARMTHDSEVSSVAFSPDGKYVVSGSVDNTIRVWEVATGTEVALMTHDARVNSVAFSPDGKYIVSGSWDNTARVWETTTSTEVARMTHDDWVYSIAFSPDGRYVASGSHDDTTRVWETTTGTEVARMTHDAPVNSASFSPDGKYILSASRDGTARIWMWQPADLIANACVSLPRNLTRAEWKQYIGDALPYQAVCPNLPIESDMTPTP